MPCGQGRGSVPSKSARERGGMEYLIGIGLAAVVCAFAAVAGFGRERVFYPTLLMVIASYYILFAVLGSSRRALVAESALACVFFALAVFGFQKSLWIIVAGLAAHGMFDFVHPWLVGNPGVPRWWTGFCLAFDVAAAGVLGVVLLRRQGFGEKGRMQL